MADQLTLQTIGILLTGLTVSIAAIYYTLTLRYTRRNQDLQLETRQAQLFWNIYDKIETRENSEMLNKVLSRTFDTPQEFHEKYGRETNAEAYYDWMYFSDLYEGLGVLVREGFVDIRFIALLMSGGVKRYWETYKPVFHDFRDTWGWPRAGIEVEYLYTQIMEYAREHPELEIQ